MVAFGGIEELRRTDHRRWVVDGPPAGSWASAVPSARVVSTDGARSVVEVQGQGADDADQQILQAALAAGAVHEFSLQRPSLTELYRHVVSADADAPELTETAGVSA